MSEELAPGTVVKMVKDWAEVTRGEEWCVTATFASPSYGESVHMALIERMPEGRSILTESRSVPRDFVVPTGEVMHRPFTKAEVEEA